MCVKVGVKVKVWVLKWGGEGVGVYVKLGFKLKVGVKSMSTLVQCTAYTNLGDG